MDNGLFFCYNLDMQDNFKRGSRTVFWTKVTLVLSVLFMILFMVVYGTLHAIQTNPDIDLEVVTSRSLLLLLGFGLVSMLLALSYSIQGLFWLLWMFRAEENLRKVTRTTFSPWGAVLCCFIPYIGMLLHFFVFRDIVRHTESELAFRRSEDVSTHARSVPMNLVVAFFGCGIMSMAVSFIGETRIVFVVSYIFGLVGAVCYLKALSAFVKEEAELYELYKDHVLRKKVDEVLREREIEKAASELK